MRNVIRNSLKSYNMLMFVTSKFEFDGVVRMLKKNVINDY